MENTSQLASKIKNGDFIVTAEYLPLVSADSSSVEKAKGFFNSGLTAVNVADNPHGPVMSSLAGALILNNAGIEPVYQVVTRDRNRIAILSDLLGAVALGIKNVLCLSGYHQSLTLCPQASNVYDIDSIQLIAAIKQMNEAGTLMDGTQIEGQFSILPGAVANPDLKPLELNMIRLAKKMDAGAKFIQTQPVFDIEVFRQWMTAAEKAGVAEKTVILAGVLPIASAAEAKALQERYTDYAAIDKVVDRIEQAGDEAAQKKEGLAVCAETIAALKAIKGVRGIHIISGGRESIVPEVINAAGL